MLGWRDGLVLGKGSICFVYSPQLHSWAAGSFLPGSEVNRQICRGVCTVLWFNGSKKLHVL